MAKIRDQFKYSVAKNQFTGYLVTGLCMEDAYFGDKTDPEEYVFLLSTGAYTYPVRLNDFHELEVSKMESEEVFPVKGDYSDKFESAVFSSGRKRCDICEFSTNRIHKVVYNSDNGVKSSVRESDLSSTVTRNYEDINSYELDSFYHCHHCMKDIHSEIERYISEDGVAVVVGHTI